MLADILHLLPKSILRCLPPAMGLETSGSFWKATNDNDCSCTWDNYRTIQPTPTVYYFLQQLSEDDKQLNARQVMHNNRSDFAFIDLEFPQTSEEDAPEAPNVYNDGSLNHALCQWWSVGGIGVIWPGRDLTLNPLNRNETNLHATRSDKA